PRSASIDELSAERDGRRHVPPGPPASASSREVSDATDERPQLVCRRQGSWLAQAVRRDGPPRVTIPISGMLTSTLSLFETPPARIINKQTRSRSVEAGRKIRQPARGERIMATWTPD